MKKKILILGSSGKLGKTLYKKIYKKFKVIHSGLKKRNIDLNNFDKLQKFVKSTNPNIIINCAAITDVDLCEKKKKLSKKINTYLLKNIFIIKKKNKLNFKFIQISTDQIYNNSNNLKSTEKSKVYCFNEYSKQKYEAEKICTKNNAIILRCNFFCNYKGNLFNWVLKSASKKKVFYLFKDIYFNPLNIFTLCKYIEKVINLIDKKNITGIFNIGSHDIINKSNFCMHIIKKIKFKNYNYKIVDSNKFFKTKRPKNMSMNVNKFEKTFKLKLPSIKNQINQYIKNNYAI